VKEYSVILSMYLLPVHTKLYRLTCQNLSIAGVRLCSQVKRVIVPKYVFGFNLRLSTLKIVVHVLKRHLQIQR